MIAAWNGDHHNPYVCYFYLIFGIRIMEKRKARSAIKERKLSNYERGLNIELELRWRWRLSEMGASFIDRLNELGRMDG